MKRYLIYSLLILSLLFLGYRLLFSYTIFPTSNTGDKKHKDNDVYYFPSVLFNPFKKQELRDMINDFVINDEVIKRKSENKKTIFWSEIIGGQYDIVSIKNEAGTKHILIEDLRYKSTLVFVMKDKKIIKFY